MASAFQAIEYARDGLRLLRKRLRDHVGLCGFEGRDRHERHGLHKRDVVVVQQPPVKLPDQRIHRPIQGRDEVDVNSAGRFDSRHKEILSLVSIGRSVSGVVQTFARLIERKVNGAEPRFNR